MAQKKGRSTIMLKLRWGAIVIRIIPIEVAAAASVPSSLTSTKVLCFTSSILALGLPSATIPPKVAQPGIPALVAQLAPERAQTGALLGQENVHAGASGAVGQADRLKALNCIIVELAGLGHHRMLLLPPAG